jgi:hypothetical protein
MISFLLAGHLDLKSIFGACKSIFLPSKNTRWAPGWWAVSFTTRPQYTREMSPQHPLEGLEFSGAQSLQVKGSEVHMTGRVDINVTLRRVSLASIIQHAIRMRFIMLSFVAWPVPPYFSTLSHKRYDLLKNVIERKMCVDFLYKICLKHFSF